MNGMTISALHEFREARRARSMASILALGTATPPNCFHQSDFPDFYFRATKSEHMTDLKDKFKRICDNSGIKKRYMFLTEEMLEKHPSLHSNKVASLNLRQQMLIGQIPEIGKVAALKAIKEWGRPISDITHLVFATSSDRIQTPSADFYLAKLLGLRRSVLRHMIYMQGCFAGAGALRLSKDLAENNAGARVLVVCVDIVTLSFCGPCHSRIGMLIGHALFADGAAAAIVGAVESTSSYTTFAENKHGLCSNGNVERPLFQMVSAEQTIEPDTEESIYGELSESGFLYWISRHIPSQVGSCVGNIMEKAFAPLRISDWNTLFYAIHPGGKAVLDQVEENLGLGAEKLRASRHVLSGYGNMWGPSVLFALDEVRNMAKKEGKATTGDGLEWGVLMAFGPGLTVETIVLRSEVST